MKLHAVYQHRDRQGQVFYVGCCATYPSRRGVRAKLQRAYATGGHSAAWVERSRTGYSVEVLEMYSDKQRAFDREVEIIALRRTEGCPLVNLSTGGLGARGVKDSPDVKRKKSITKIGELNPMHGKTGISHPLARPVVNVQNGVFFESVAEAADALGYTMQTFHKWMTGARPNKTLWRLA